MKTFNLALVALLYIFSNSNLYSNNGLTCTNSISIVENQNNLIDFPQGVNRVYLNFNSNSIRERITITEELGFVYPSIESLNIYDNNCSNLEMSYDNSLNFPTWSEYFKYGVVFEGDTSQNYIIEIVRNSPGLPFTKINVMYLPSLISSCTPSNLQCDLLDNGDLQTTSGFIVPNVAFNNNVICYWEAGDNSPSYLSSDGSLSNTIDKVGVMYISRSTIPNYLESLLKEAQITKGQKYTLSFETSDHKTGVQSAGVGCPDDFNIALINSSDVPPIQPSNPNMRTGPVYSITPRQNLATISNITFCTSTYSSNSITFEAEDNFDRILFYPTLDPTNIINAAVRLNNVSLELAADGGDDVTGFCSVQIGPNPPFPGASYAWAPAAPLNSAFVANPIVNTGTNQTFTVTVTFPSGCTSTDDVNVNIAGTNVLSNKTASYIINNYPNQSGNFQIPQVSNLDFQISGTLTIDTDIHFKNCNFYMSENSKIVVNKDLIWNVAGSNTFQMKSCASELMWDGIYVNGSAGATIRIDGRNPFPFNGNQLDIMNSENGVVIEDGPGSYIGYTIFDLNEKSIQVLGPSSLPIDIVWSEFKCSSPLNSPGLGDFYPTKAIIVENNENQNPSHPFDPYITSFYKNSFDGSAGQFYTKNSDVEIVENNFTGFSNLLTFGVNKSDVAIKVEGTEIINPLSKILIDDNDFIFNESSIEIEKSYECIINSNTSNSGIEGSRFLLIKDNLSPPNVYSNTINNAQRGIDLVNVPFALINNNTIDAETNSGGSQTFFNKKSVGVYVNNLFLDMPDFVNIINNTIKHTKIGIEAEWSSGTILDNDILDMNISLTSGCDGFFNSCLYPIGIRSLNSLFTINQNKVENNSSLYPSPPSEYEYVTAISVENSATPFQYTSNVTCNNTINTGVGLRFSGNCDGTEIRSNRMEDHTRGLALDNEANVGAIGDAVYGAGNTWFGNYNSTNKSMTYNYSYLVNPTYYDVSGQLPAIAPSDASAGYVAMVPQQSSLPNNFECSVPLFVVSGGKPKTNYTFNKSGSRGLGPLYKRNLGSTKAVNLNHQLIYLAMLKDSLTYNSKRWKHFSDSMKNTIIGFGLNKNTRSNIRSITTMDSRFSSINTILRKYNLGLNIDSTDLSVLETVAYLCPYNDGAAVYLARNILYENGYSLIINSCEVSTSIRKNTKNKTHQNIGKRDSVESVVSIFPNPNTGNFSVLYTLGANESIEFMVFDINGKLVLRKRLIEGELHNFDISTSKAGIYFYQLVNEEHVIERGKLIKNN